MCFLLNNNKKILSFRLPCFCNPTTQVSTEPESGAGREISFFHRRFNTENVTEAHYSPALPKAENPCRAGQMSSFLFPGLCNKGCLVRIQGLLSTSELVRPRNTSQILVNYCSRKGSKAVCQFPLLPSPPPPTPFQVTGDQIQGFASRRQGLHPGAMAKPSGWSVHCFKILSSMDAEGSFPCSLWLSINDFSGAFTFSRFSGFYQHTISMKTFCLQVYM